MPVALRRQLLRRLVDVGVWSAGLADSVKGAVKETTYASYAYVSRNHLSPAIGHVKLKSLTPVRVRGFYGDKGAPDSPRRR